MFKCEAIAIIQAITEDIISNRGDVSSADLRRWANSYPNWARAAAILTPVELDDAILGGRLHWLDDLADEHENDNFVDDGELAYGRED